MYYDAGIRIFAESFDGAGISEEDYRRLVLIRDLEGKLRLAIHWTGEEAKAKQKAWEEGLEEALEGWFRGPIISLPSTGQEKRIAEAIFRASDEAGDAATFPPHWKKEALGVGRSPAKWKAIQRVHSKEAWLKQEEGRPVWTRGEGPTIVAFYSYKGGVGRTTTLGAVARLLAKERKRVVCVDLDLEAPGLAAFFQTPTYPGVLDELLRLVATTRSTAWEGGPFSVEWELPGRVWVYPAGEVDAFYLEKLARLDYLSHAIGEETQIKKSPVERALRALLEQIKTTYQPDFIFLDTRAGLHDLGGLSLNDLSHIEVLVGRQNEQSLRGLGLILKVLAKRRKIGQHRLVIVQTMIPLDEGSRLPQQERYQARVHELFVQARLFGDDLPPTDAEDSLHYPWWVGNYAELATLETIKDTAFLPVLENENFQRIKQRIVELSEQRGDE